MRNQHTRLRLGEVALSGLVNYGVICTHRGYFVQNNQVFTPDVEGNPGDLPVIVECRRPYAIAVVTVTDSVVRLVAAN